MLQKLKSTNRKRLASLSALGAGALGMAAGPANANDIVFSGVRPGEKLFEEILTARERENPTVNTRLFMAQQERIEYERLAESLGRLDLAVRTPAPAAVVDHMQRLVPSYTPSPMLLARDDVAPIRPAKGPVKPSVLSTNGADAAKANGAVEHGSRALAGSVDAGD